MHDTVRSGPCGLPDGHRDRHRTPAGAARERARKARWDAENPVKRTLIWVKQNAGRRAA